MLSYVFDEHIVAYCTWHVLQETIRISNVVGQSIITWLLKCFSIPNSYLQTSRDNDNSIDTLCTILPL
jgi:hypothetical protein